MNEHQFSTYTEMDISQTLQSESFFFFTTVGRANKHGCLLQGKREIPNGQKDIMIVEL